MRRARACFVGLGLFLCHRGISAVPPPRWRLPQRRGRAADDRQGVLENRTMLLADGVIVAIAREHTISIRKGTGGRGPHAGRASMATWRMTCTY